eukprot:gene5640-6336_t
MEYKLLFRLSVKLLDSFRPQSQGVEELLDAFIKTNCKNIDEDSLIFLTEVFSGCRRYSNALKIVTDKYYRTDGSNCLAADKNIYTVIAYLALFRLDELGISHFRKFILSQDLTKIIKFLSFFCEETTLKTWMFAEWCKLYEHSFVQINLLSPILRWLPELTEMIENISQQLSGKSKQRNIKSTTEIKPFTLTRPRPRSVPVPEKIPKLKQHKPVPASTYRVPKDHEVLTKKKEENRKMAERQLIRASMKQFDCANAEKSEKTKEKIRKHINEEESKLDFTRHKARSAPSTSANMPIRLNAAAILREGALISQQEDDLERRLADFSKGGRDASDFLKWQQDMKERDLSDKLAAIERKRLEGKLSFEEAILARQNLIKENKQKVQEIKQETKEMMEKYLQDKFKREHEMRNLVQQVMNDGKNAKEAKVKLKDYKRKIVHEVNKESQNLMRMALEEAEDEMRQKVALIAKIRAIESVPVIRFKYVDLTDVAGAGLLGEMSVAELRERLALLKVKQKDEEEKKRDEIIQTKVEKDQYLMDTLQSIAKRRTEKEREQAKRADDKKRVQREEIKDGRILELQQKLENKRAERRREVQALQPKSTKTTRQKELAKQKKSLEEMRWTELENTREKAAKLKSSRTQYSSVKA